MLMCLATAPRFDSIERDGKRGPAASEVLIRITHAGINFMDIHTRDGNYAKSQTYQVGLPTLN